MEKEELLKQIKKYCRHSNKVHRLSSYGLKAFFEGLQGFGIIDYVSNDMFKEAMIEAGYRPTRETMQDDCPKYRVSIIGENVDAYWAYDGRELYRRSVRP